MTEPTDAELLALIEKHLGFKPRRDDMVIDPRTGRFHDVQRYRDLKADILAKWGTPAVAKWAPEEIADGERGIRWVTNEGIHGRPTDHDVREYLKQTPTAHGCHCDECKQFYTTPQPTQAQAEAVPLTDEQLAEMMRETWGCASIAPRHAMKFARAIEAAHGISIKGGLLALSERAGVQLNTPEPLEALRYRLLREAERGVQCEVSETEALEFRRLQYGLSRRDFAEILGIMPSHFSEILSGKRRLPINAVARAVAIGVPVTPLLQGRPSSGSKPKGGQHGAE